MNFKTPPALYAGHRARLTKQWLHTQNFGGTDMGRYTVACPECGTFFEFSVPRYSELSPNRIIHRAIENHHHRTAHTARPLHSEGP